MAVLWRSRMRSVKAIGGGGGGGGILSRTGGSVESKRHGISFRLIGRRKTQTRSRSVAGAGKSE
ncbi:hypothetical protein H6P81_018299 [Aristolochia fimbriata]|uniref:Uncharacterized protein n=1 Tax=Aristolochia fimbriata TaxID=158543 RepID=A0AAV7E0Q1_ARIFI|nr:hypothetical protein H6P81_018299 [Aristolochia fimbriata]